MPMYKTRQQLDVWLHVLFVIVCSSYISDILETHTPELCTVCLIQSSYTRSHELHTQLHTAASAMHCTKMTVTCLQWTYNMWHFSVIKHIFHIIICSIIMASLDLMTINREYIKHIYIQMEGETSQK